LPDDDKLDAVSRYQSWARAAWRSIFGVVKEDLVVAPGPRAIAIWLGQRDAHWFSAPRGNRRRRRCPRSYEVLVRPKPDDP
jgi:hypothetical protein